MSEKTEIACRLFNSGFNCAQAVVGAFSPVEEGQAELVLKLASSFGGGMRCGEVCGAVTGALMVLGLREGQYVADDLDAKKKSAELTSRFMEEYYSRKGALLCRELLGYDIRDPAAKGKSAASKREVCEDAIKTAILLLEEVGIR